jgi:hypothetical protein
MRLVAALAVFGTACSDSTTPSALLGTDFTVGAGETVDVTDAGLSIKFVRVKSDSRCPTGALCISQGNAVAELEVRLSSTPATVYLSTFEQPREAIAGSYNIRLMSLAPLQSTGHPVDPRDYRVTLVVTRSSIVCTADARPALLVGLTDSLTGATTGFTGVTIAAREVAYIDSVQMTAYPAPPYNGPIPLAYERKGKYDVYITTALYLPWNRIGIVVTGDLCHVTPVSVTARLVRDPSQ